MANSFVAADTLLSAGTVLPNVAGISLPDLSQGRNSEKRVINGAARSDVAIRKIRDGMILIQTTTDIQSNNILEISEIPVSDKTKIKVVMVGCIPGPFKVKVEPHRFLNVYKRVVTCFDLDCVTIGEICEGLAPQKVTETSSRPVLLVSARDTYSHNVSNTVSTRLLREETPPERPPPPPVAPRSPPRRTPPSPPRGTPPSPLRGTPPSPPRVTKVRAVIVGSPTLVSGSPKSKLRSIRDCVSRWPSSIQNSRRGEVIVTRLHVRHTFPTHGFLLRGDQPPVCEFCDAPLSAYHILVECRKYAPIHLVLNFKAPEVLIVDDQGQAVYEKFYEEDSTIQLDCIVRHVSMTSSVVNWLHEYKQLNYDTTRGGISVKTDLTEEGANSSLSVARVTKQDTGNYTCSISSTEFAAVYVHVLQGESLAELHHGNQGCPTWLSTASLVQVGLVLLLSTS
uniref:Ig-like domain-containing protein n=1 Tax=Timema tahoe TaxID=61484 RepID=A0A7R9P0B9_9NEOP|nr:unnamed protein product [Timema tahoe]